MKSSKDIKNIVRDKYAKIVTAENSSCCAETTGESSASICCGGDKNYSVFNDDYSNLKGYEVEADLNLGCGVPTQHTNIKKGDTVIDLGSGAGNDVFVARSLVGENGHVIGVDMTPEMVNKALLNNSKLQYKNVDFRLGEIENLPINDNSADVVISNCVLNLVPDKQKAFSEIYRVLKINGHFCISDVVLKGTLNKELQKSAEMYAGCVAGALQEDEYLNIIKEAGFKNVELKAKKEIILPDDLLKKYMDAEAYKQFQAKPVGIYSITVSANKE